MNGGPRVVKMSGSGNDFLVLGPEGRGEIRGDRTEWVRRVCRRGLSVGADGVLFVELVGEGRVRVRFHNPDGSPAFCGNGSRCAARFAHRKGWVGAEMTLLTTVGEVPAAIRGSRVRLVLPAPQDLGSVALRVASEQLDGRFVAAGVPHFVIFVDNVDEAPLARWGPLLRRHPRFGPQGVNVDIVAPRADGSLAIRTWERGVEGETMACGSGAVAAAFAAGLDGGPQSARIVPASGVPLEISLPGGGGSPRAAILEGDARVIFEGTLDPEATIGFRSSRGAE